MGAGKIYKNEKAKKNPYWFQIMVNGKRVTRRGFRTKGEAQKARDELSTQLNKGEYIDPSKALFRDYFLEWLENRKNLADSTVDMYDSYFRNHIDPALGKIPLSKITPTDILNFIKTLRNTKTKSGENLSDEMVKRVYSTVNTALNSAVTMEIIQKNVASKIPKQDKPKVVRQERQIWSNDSIRVFLKKTKGETRYWIAIFLAVMTGMRQGEILGLKWSDIDFDKSVLYVRRSLKKDKTGFTNLKTASSRRTISLAPYTIMLLKEQQEKIAMEKEYLGDDYQDNDLVVCTSKGTPAKATRVLHAWNRLCEKFKPEHEPRITFHDLRHQSASIMLNDGTDTRVVSGRLGHSTVTTTLDVYSHLIPTAQENAAVALEKTLGFNVEQQQEFLQ
ncbi:tyrosine-type recombinase/integrase [Paenibacillus oleatilyticus]|uniref:tyrosine-type recombinase/integrase n=1 Tax=Paenibacillus oleatilyticus TaxID=2594886 RepID=UPI001C1F95BB|nr:tyrosine-type recombinase/integrase [Paenibacillus oleatilyticus]MBU7314067.1 site-specific integrase [Paenibacillus oleatilyticus]